MDFPSNALTNLVRPPDFLPYSDYGLPHDLSIQGKISRYYLEMEGGIEHPRRQAVLIGDLAEEHNKHHVFIVAY